MGAYAIERIDQDFAICGKGLTPEAISPLVDYAKIVLLVCPDNKARDFAISNLLQAASMVANSYRIGKDNESTQAPK